MARSDVEGGKRHLWKILEIRGHDDLSARPDGCRQHMPIIRIGEGELVDQVTVASDQAIRDGLG